MSGPGIPSSDPAAPVRVRVVDLGLACCALEYSAATVLDRAWDDMGAIPVTDGPAEVLVVAGTVTHALLPSVLASWQAMPERRAVVSFGACSTSGGPYWDSYAVVPGLAAAGIPVDVHVPGCPPPPSAVIEAVRAACDLVGIR